MTTPEMSTDRVSVAKSDAVMDMLHVIANGPREAYCILITCIWRLNYEDQGKANGPVSIDQLCAEVSTSLRSVKKGVDH